MKRILVLLLVASLAGCFSPDIPDDALVSEDAALPGLKLTAWTEDAGGRVRMHGVIENEGDVSYDIRIGCGHPWVSTILSSGGQEVHFREVLEEPGCAPFWDVLAPGGDMEVQYSWDGRDHDVENDTHVEMPSGVYLWTLQFTLRDREEHLEAITPIIIGGEADPLDGFVMELAAYDTYKVNVTVTNNGTVDAPYWHGCMTEWGVRILDAEGAAVPLEPMATCEGFSEETFRVGAVVMTSFAWDGMVWDDADGTSSPAPAGDYAWEVTFGLQGTQGDVLVETVAFTVA